jgi:hypothetical protein
MILLYKRLPRQARRAKMALCRVNLHPHPSHKTIVLQLKLWRLQMGLKAQDQRRELCLLQDQVKKDHLYLKELSKAKRR